MTYSNYCIVCPYCGDEKEDEYDHPEMYFEEGSHDAYCGVCDKEYVVNTEVKYSYETEKIEEVEE